MGRRYFIVLLGVYAGFPSLLLSWWETGHQVVARIAAAHLTPAARTRVARILNVPDTTEAVADGLATGSTWADEIKTDTKTGSWHYINLTFQDHKSDIPARCENDNCAPVRIRLFAAQLASQSADARWSELDALRFLVHLVADIHQPLHTISDADLGGNCEQVNPPIGQAANLHALWDGAIVQAMGLNDRALAAHLENDIKRIRINEQQKLIQGNQDDWVWESHILAEKDIYRRLRVPVEPVDFPASCDQAPVAITKFRPAINRSYIDSMKPVARMQLEKAGLRLARLLNESL